VSAIAQLLVRQGLRDGFRQQGHRLFGPCPVHGGDNPRAFVVDLRGDRWYCFTGCQRGGGPATLARAMGLPSGGMPPYVPPPPSPPFVPYTRRLGLTPGGPWLRAKGIYPAVCRDREVGAWAGRGMLRDCIALRLHDTNGAPLGYAGRRLDPEEVRRRGKWVFPPRLPKSQLLYGLHRVRGTRIVLTECSWGVLRLAQLGIDAVALLGVGLSNVQATHLEAFDRVVVLLDGDDAGQAASRPIAARLQAPIATLPPGADPDDLDDESLRALLLPFLMP
jgi:DNA primase